MQAIVSQKTEYNHSMKILDKLNTQDFYKSRNFKAFTYTVLTNRVNISIAYSDQWNIQIIAVKISVHNNIGDIIIYTIYLQ